MRSQVLVYRLSSMGDVAMVASLLKELSFQNPDYDFVIVSNHFYRDFFEGIKNVTFHPFYPKSTHQGIKGLLKLKGELSKYPIDLIADLHGSLRTRMLNIDSIFKNIQHVVINKERKIKKRVIASIEPLTPLKPTIQRYADVFTKLGLKISLSNKLSKHNRPRPELFRESLEKPSIHIGISPFAQHPYKVWDLKNWHTVFNSFSEADYSFYIFGGGKKEQDIATDWSSEHRNVVNCIGKLTLKEELDLISNLEYMISMDSSGMHMASLVGIRCLSIWGATHPYLGFLGYGQSFEDCIQVDHPNRPSSIYGDKPCLCDGVEAIDLVNPEMVINKIKEVSEK